MIDALALLCESSWKNSLGFKDLDLQHSERKIFLVPFAGDQVRKIQFCMMWQSPAQSSQCPAAGTRVLVGSPIGAVNVFIPEAQKHQKWFSS